RLLLAGEPDTENPDAFDRTTLERWGALPGVRWLGHVEDVRKVWDEAHVAVLASVREGLPKTLLEAAAVGRPIVGADVPGTRAIARAGENALLVPPGDERALADALAVLASDRDLRRSFGKASRRIVEQGFSDDAIAAQTLSVYRLILTQLCQAT
ncbi:MAG: glycosyltransferase, partial [Stellaceae bacterium]